MRRGRDGRDEPDERDEPAERDGADWLLGELADDDEPADPPSAGQAGASAEPAPADVPAPEPAAWSSRREHRDDGDEWFSIAPAPRPAQPGPVDDVPAARPAGDIRAGGGEPIGAPGPVTPTAPFALTWGDAARDPDNPGGPFAPPRAARRSFTPPFDDSEPVGRRPADAGGATPAGEPTAVTPPSANAAPAGPPAVPAGEHASARSSAEQPPSEPVESAGGQPVDDYGAALWSALTEPDEPDAPAAAAGTSEDAPAAPSAAGETGSTVSGTAGGAGAPGGTGVPGSQGAGLSGAAAVEASGTDAVGAAASEAEHESAAQRPRQPFPAFARARWGESGLPPAAAPVDDLLGGSGDVPVEPAPPIDTTVGDADTSHTGELETGEVESTGPQAGFVWNLTPDPNAADPAVAVDRPRRGARPDEPEPVASQPEEAAFVEPEAGPVAGPTEPGPDGVEPGEAQTDATRVFATPAPPAPAPAPPAPAPAPAPPVTAATAALPTAARQPEASARPSAPVTQRTAAMSAAGPSTASGARPSASGARPSGGGPGSGRSGRAGSGGSRRRTRLLLWIGGGLVVALVLAGLYLLGTQLAGGGEAEEPVATPSPSAEPTPEPAPEPAGPQPAGAHAWDTLFGGECLDGFTTPWAEEFTVVDCAAPHAAQLVLRGELAEDAAAPFPGEAELGSRMTALCTAPGVIEVGAAAGVNDLQVQGSYPVTEEQWAEGERTYYCFVNRAGGEPLTGSLQGPGPAA